MFIIILLYFNLISRINIYIIIFHEIFFERLFKYFYRKASDLYLNEIFWLYNIIGERCVCVCIYYDNKVINNHDGKCKLQVLPAMVCSVSKYQILANQLKSAKHIIIL